MNSDSSPAAGNNALHWIRKHLYRLQFGQFLGILADQLALSFVALGCLILLAKLFVPALWPHVLWLWLLLLAVPVVSWLKVRGRAFTETEAAALLDRKLNAGGLLMMVSESGDTAWQNHLPQLENLWRQSLPRFRPTRFVSLVAVPLLFALIACLVPVREFQSVMATPRKVAQETSQELEEILKTLEESEVLDEKEKAELKKELEKFADETQDQPLTHEQWETADLLRQQMQMSWEKHERSMQSAGLAVQELLSEMANKGELSADQLQQLEQALGENLQSLASQTGKSDMSEQLQNTLNQLAKSGQLKLPKDAAEREKLLQELKEKLQSECEKLAKERSECQGLCQRQCNGQGDCNSPGNNPGKGGVTRGRGDAPMVWGKESDLENTKFKEVVLPPGFKDEAGEQVIRMTMSEPEADPAVSAPRLSLKQTDPSAGRATWNRKLNPKHRGVVRKFFDSEKNQPSIPEDQSL